MPRMDQRSSRVSEEHGSYCLTMTLLQYRQCGIEIDFELRNLFTSALEIASGIAYLAWRIQYILHKRHNRETT